MENKDEFINDFITVGKLREMLSELDDNDFITVTKGHSHQNYKITHIEESTAFGFWELRIK